MELIAHVYSLSLSANDTVALSLKTWTAAAYQIRDSTLHILALF